MTPQEFETILGQHEWHLTESGRIRGGMDHWCPLVIAQLPKGRGDLHWVPDLAARRLHIPKVVALNIVQASDNTRWMTPRQRLVRAMLLRLCRLEESR